MPNLKFVGDEQIPLETPKVGIIQNLDLVPIKRQPEASTEAGNTTFLFKKKDISLDLLTDSGVNAISDRQTSPTPDADDDTHPGTRPPAAPGTQSIPYRAALFALALGGFTIGTTEFVTMALLPDIASSFGVSNPTVGQSVTAYAAGVVIGAPALAFLGSRLGRRRLLILLMSAVAAASVASALAASAQWLILARFASGLPHGAFFGVGAAVGAQVVGPNRRGRAVAAMMSGLTIAFAVGVPASAVVASTVGWRWAFAGIGAMGVITVLAAWRWVPKLPASPETNFRGELRALRNRPLWIAFLAGGVGFSGMFAAYTYVKPLLTDVAGIPLGAVPIVLVLYGIGSTAGTLLGGRLADRSVLGTVIGGMVAMTASLVMLAVVGHAAVPAVIALVLVGVTAQVLGLALQTHLMDLSPNSPALGAALCHSALNVGNACGALFGGIVVDLGWGYLAPDWVGAALTAVGLLVILRVSRRSAPAAAPMSGVAGLVEPASLAHEYPSAVLWDMDGTLVDSEPFWIAAEYAIVAEHGDYWDDDLANSVVGNQLLVTAQILIDAGGVRLPVQEVAERLMNSVIEHVRQIPPWRPGVLELLVELREAGVPLALVTSGWLPLVQTLLRHLPPGHFDVIVTGNQVTHGKPHPEPYLTALEQLVAQGVDPNRAVAIEDSRTGLRSAETAGLKTIAVPHMAPIDGAPGRTVLATLAGVRAKDLNVLIQAPAALSV